MTAELLINDIDGIRHVVFNRPEARNALTFAMYEGLADACRSVSGDDAITAVIISGAGGKAFAAGTDMAQFRGFAGPEDAWAYEEKMEAILTAVETCSVPTIAAVNGACTGGGGAIAAACDLRIATRTLKFGFPIARTLGNCLSAGNLARLTSLMGHGRVADMMLRARLIEADEALQIGLVSEILDDEPALLARATAIASTLSEHAPLTMRATREALRRLRNQTTVDDRDLIALCYTSADFKEGIEAFLGKRKPQWKGK